MLRDIVLGVAGGVLASWIAMVVVLLIVKPKNRLLMESVRLLPDLLRLLTRLATDPSLPRGVRIRLGLLLAYLAVPIDIVPDFVPVLGYADDAIVVVAVLRSVIRRAGIDALKTHWLGSQDGFRALCRVVGFPGTSDDSADQAPGHDPRRLGAGEHARPTFKR